MGGLGLIENGALSSNGRFDLHQSVDTFPFATPVVADSTHFLASIKIHSTDSFSRFFFEKFFAHAAIGAEPGIRQIFKGRSRSNTSVWVAYRWIVNITAGRTNPFTHNNVSFLVALI